MSKYFDIPSRRVKVATYTAGGDLTLGTDKRVTLSGFDGWRPLSNAKKAILLALEFVVSGTFTLNAASAKLPAFFLNYMLDIPTLKGAGGIELIRNGKGWWRGFLNYMQAGQMRGLFTRDLAANGGGSPANYTRTFNQFVDFVEHRSPDPYARCWPAECFFGANTGGAELQFNMKGAVQTLFTGGAAATLGFTAGTVTIYAHMADVDARRVRIPTMLLERMIPTDQNVVNPSPKAGVYTRLLIANSPAPADNPGATADDLSAYTQLDYFGYNGNFPIYKEDVAGYIQRVSDEISEEQRPVFDDPTSERSDAYLFNPLTNFDGHLRGIPLQYLRSGESITASRVFKDDPKLGANGDARGGLPTAINFISQEPIARTAQQTSAILASISRAGNPQANLQGRGTSPDPKYAGSDPSRSPAIVDAS